MLRDLCLVKVLAWLPDLQILRLLFNNTSDDEWLLFCRAFAASLLLFSVKSV